LAELRSRREINIMNDEQKKANLKTGLILASVALVFLVGFVIKMVILGK
jgi:hypothetical protein